MSHPFRINFICTGNSCRSPIAEGLMRNALRERGLDGAAVVESSGISAVEGAAASSGALMILQKRDATLRDFKSRVLTKEIVEECHLLLVMERYHRDHIEEQYPEASDKVRLLADFLFPNYREDIPDPVGGDEELFENITRLIEAAIQRIIHDWDAIRDRFYHSRRLTVALAADHRGFSEKERIKKSIAQAGYSIIDCGTDSEESCDHPDYALRAAQLVSIGQADRAILLCGSGHGMVISANKAISVRAVYAVDEEHAKLSRQHNNANVIALGADFTPSTQIDSIILTWLKTPYLGGKYQRRINKITDFERMRQLPA